MQLSFSETPFGASQNPYRAARAAVSHSPRMSAVPLSVVIVARNEEQNLPRCLASVQGWTAEIVVVLNNTNDRSAEVADRHGAVVFETEWRGFRDTKNWAVDRATQAWVLCLDADEEVSAALQAEIRQFFQENGHHRCHGVRFPRKVWFIDRWITHGDWYPDLSLRLFNRHHGRWGGDAYVHEKVEVDGAIATLRADLHHFSFPSISSHVAKINPFADLFMQQRQAAGARFSLATAVLRPGWRFVRAYVLRGGFLDGYPGLYIACATSFGAFVRYSRLFEHEHRRPPPHA